MGQLLEDIVVLELGACIPLAFLILSGLPRSLLTLLSLSLNGCKHLFQVPLILSNPLIPFLKLITLASWQR